MADIGKASLLIVPKFDNLGKTVAQALRDVDADKAGEALGENLDSGIQKGSSGLMKSGALTGIFAAVTHKAMGLVSSSVDGAVSRLDTLNNYPRVMQALGYSAEDSERSISTMSERLKGLPTTLDGMVSTVQGLSAITGDLDLATEAGLAMNNMLLASGSNQQLVNSALEQFRQMLSKGTPEMQEWKSLTTAMPGQMKQLAEEMLGAGAQATDLYEALGGGGAEATISMDELMAKIIELNHEGGSNFASFEEQARNATDGIATSGENMATAVSRGVANIMDSFGAEGISGIMGGIGSAFEGALNLIADGVEFAMPLVSGLAGTFKSLLPELTGAAGGLLLLAGAGKGISGVISVSKKAATAISGLGTSFSVLGGLLKGPVAIGVSAAAVGIGILVGKYLDAKKKSEDFEKATKGLSDAVNTARGLDTYAGQIDIIGNSASTSAMSVDELVDSMKGHAEAIDALNESAQTQIGELNTAQQIISDYAGMTDLSVDAQGRLEWAIGLVNDQFGLSIDAMDVANGYYLDADGNVIQLTGSIYDLVEAKKTEIQMATLSDVWSELYQAEADSAATLVAAKSELNIAQDNYNRALAEMEGKEVYSQEDIQNLANYEQALNDAGEKVDQLSDAHRTASESLRKTEETLGDLAVSTSESASELDKWGLTMSSEFLATLDQSGTSIASLKQTLDGLGASTEDLAGLSEPQLLRLAESYDGSAASIIGSLNELNVGIDDNKSKSALAADAIKHAFETMGSDVESRLNGVNLSDFSRKLAEAGVSTEDLLDIGTANISLLAEAFDGDVSKMTWAIENFNDAEIVDKEGNVHLDDVELIDAQGRVYTWNGENLVDKDGVAAIDDTVLQTAQGRVLTWNKGNLVDKSGNAIISGNVAQSLIDRDNWNNGSFLNKYASAVVDIIQTTKGNAAGGIRANAAGGYRFHAGGAIVNRATPLDIVGEDGAEAIIPLSNERYSIPFARTLAKQMDTLNDKSELALIAQLLEQLPERIAAVMPEETALKVNKELDRHIRRVVRA